MTVTPDIGTVVRLNSGGPNMVVSSDRAANGTVFCIWINEMGVAQKELFPIACITEVRRDKLHITQPRNDDGTEFRVGQSSEGLYERFLWRLKRDLNALDDKA